MRSTEMGDPGTVCIPVSAKDQTRKFGCKCMTLERIVIFNVRIENSCREGIIKGHGKFKCGENDKRASKNTNINMMEEVMERTSFYLEKKSVLQCQERLLNGLHIDDDFFSKGGKVLWGYGGHTHKNGWHADAIWRFRQIYC